MDRKYKAAGFDLGDTLLYYRDTPLNWSALYPDALRAVAKGCGAKPTSHEITDAEKILASYNTRLSPRTHEVRADEIFKKILAAWHIDNPDVLPEAIAEFFQFFQQRLSSFPETKSVLATLRERKIPIGILTDVPYGMPREFVENDLTDGGIAGLIDVVLTSVEVGLRKPESAGYLALAARLGVSPAEMVYVGNEPKDVIGARDAGAIAILIDREATGQNHGQAFTISRLDELL